MSRTAALHLVGALALGAATVAPASTSHAWDRWHHDGGWGGGRAWQGNGVCGGCGVAGALLGLGVGAVFGAALAMERGRHHRPIILAHHQPMPRHRESIPRRQWPPIRGLSR